MTADGNPFENRSRESLEHEVADLRMLVDNLKKHTDLLAMCRCMRFELKPGPDGQLGVGVVQPGDTPVEVRVHARGGQHRVELVDGSEPTWANAVMDSIHRRAMIDGQKAGKAERERKNDQTRRRHRR